MCIVYISSYIVFILHIYSQSVLYSVEAPVLSVSSTTATSISLSWTSGGSEGVSYEVMWTSDDMEDKSNVIITDGSTNYTISDLRRGVSYTITVNATNAAGTSSRATLAVQTEGMELVIHYCIKFMMCKNVPDIMIDATTPTSISLSWTSGGLEVASYKVVWKSIGCPDDENEGNDTIIDDGSGIMDPIPIINYTIMDLRNGTNYNITVIASNTTDNVPIIFTSSRTEETGKKRR